MTLKNNMTKLIRPLGEGTFALLIDGHPYTSGKNQLRVKYYFEESIRTAYIGYFEKSSSNNKRFIDLENQFDDLEEKLTRTSFGSVDVSFLEGNPYTLNYLPELKLITVNSLPYTFAQDVASDRNVAKAIYNGRRLLDSEINSIRKELLGRSASDFDLLMRKSIQLKLSRRPGTSMMMRLPSYMPWCVKIKGIFNPMSDYALIADDIMKSKLINISHCVEFDTMHVYFATHKEICECLGIQPIRLTHSFIYPVILGLFDDNFPNRGSRVFITDVENLDRVVTQEQYDNLTDAYKVLYRPYDRLAVHCMMHYRNLGFTAWQDLYGIVTRLDITKLL